MTHKRGTRLDGVVTLEDFRERCVIDADSGCWHLRKGHGGAFPVSQTATVWYHPAGKRVGGRRVAWFLAHGQWTSPKQALTATCLHHDCCAPDHLRLMARSAAPMWHARRGSYMTPRKLAAIWAQAVKRSVLTPEVRRWVLESTQPATVVGPAVGLSASRIAKIRKRERERGVLL